MLNKAERHYDTHKLEFLALKWAIMDRFHEYLYSGEFDVFTDNNLLTYILTTSQIRCHWSMVGGCAQHLQFPDLLQVW